MNELKLEYLEILLGNKEGFSAYHFVNALPGGSNQQKALDCIRFAIENLLEWDVQTAKQKFDGYMIHLLKLDRLADFIVYPPELGPRDCRYILSLLYPDTIHLSEQGLIEELYQRILDGSAQFPR